MKKKYPSRHRDSVLFFLNGTPQSVSGPNAGMMLADYLRIRKNLTGTKVVCAEGDCGACSVLRISPNPTSDALFSRTKNRFMPVNSCITSVAQMDGASLVTVDALAETPSSPTLVQQAMVDHHGSQCGFCTPGFVMALTGLVEKKICEGVRSGNCSKAEVKNALTGNLCRCTGYEPIFEAATSVDLKAVTSIQKRFFTPSQKKTILASRKKSLLIEEENYRFYAPLKLSDACQYLVKNKTARLISSGTDLGVVHNKLKIKLDNLVSLHLIDSLYEIKTLKKTKTRPARLRVGARVDLSQLRRATKKIFPELASFLDLFASPQIKNTATLIGNIGNASPIADTPPFLLATQAVLYVQGPKGKRSLPLDEFFLDYRKTALKKGELIYAIEFEIPEKSEHFGLYKISQRKDLDISTVNAAFRMGPSGSKIALGGVAAIPLRLKKTETYLNKIEFSKDSTANQALIQEAIRVLQSEIKPMDDLRGSSTFRRLVVENLFRKFLREKVGVQ